MNAYQKLLQIDQEENHRWASCMKSDPALKPYEQFYTECTKYLKMELANLPDPRAKNLTLRVLKDHIDYMMLCNVWD